MNFLTNPRIYKQNYMYMYQIHPTYIYMDKVWGKSTETEVLFAKTEMSNQLIILNTAY